MESLCFQRPSSEVCWALLALGFHPLPPSVKKSLGLSSQPGPEDRAVPRVRLVTSPARPRHSALPPLPHPYLSLGSPNLLCLAGASAYSSEDKQRDLEGTSHV